MIASCTKCRTNYNIDESRIQGGRVLLRCQVCSHWFSVAVKSEPEEKIETAAPEPVVTVPETAEEKPIEQPVDENVVPESISADPPTEHPALEEPETEIAPVEYEIQQAAAENVEPEVTAAEPESQTEEAKPAYLKLLVADTPNQFRTRVVKTLNEIDPTLELVVVDDGGLAMGALAGFAPDLAIIGTAIDKVYCFEICDYMRATDRLKDTRIVFAAELHQAAWNCAEPESLYGADAWMSNAATDDELFAGLRDHLETVRTSHQQMPS